MSSPGTDLMHNGADLLDDHATPGYSNGSLTGIIRQSWGAAEDRAHRGSSLRASAAVRYDDE